MQVSALLLSALLVLSPSAFARKKRIPPVQRLTGVVQRCHDGDTCRVLVGNKSLKIRFAGIDCPELSQKYGKEARNFTEAQIKDKNVNLECNGTSFDRLTCTVFLGERNINMEIVEHGWAYDSTKYSHGRFIAAVSTARAKGLGIWKDSNLVSPYCYRHKSNRKCSSDPGFMP